MTGQHKTKQYNTIQYNTIQYNTIQYNTIQYNTIQYNTIQYNKIQYNTIQHNTMSTPKKTKKRKRSQKIFRTKQTNPEGIKSVPWPAQPTIQELGTTIWIDEAGMGSWAGPLHVAGTVVLPNMTLQGIHDSKLLRNDEREKLYDALCDNSNLLYHVESISNTELDSVGGLGCAWRLGIKRVIENLQNQVLALDNPSWNIQRVVLDGNKTVAFEGLPRVTSVTKADQKYTGVGAASILAKVSRDRKMILYGDSCVPEYVDIFKKGKGYWYGPKHTELVSSGKFTDLHRRTFNPLKTYLSRKHPLLTARKKQKLQLKLLNTVV
jgi:ribonuclease HII